MSIELLEASMSPPPRAHPRILALVSSYTCSGESRPGPPSPSPFIFRSARGRRGLRSRRGATACYCAATPASPLISRGTTCPCSIATTSCRTPPPGAAPSVLSPTVPALVVVLLHQLDVVAIWILAEADANRALGELEVDRPRDEGHAPVLSSSYAPERSSTTSAKWHEPTEPWGVMWV